MNGAKTQWIIYWWNHCQDFALAAIDNFHCLKIKKKHIHSYSNEFPTSKTWVNFQSANLSPWTPSPNLHAITPERNQYCSWRKTCEDEKHLFDIIQWLLLIFWLLPRVNCHCAHQTFAQVKMIQNERWTDAWLFFILQYIAAKYFSPKFAHPGDEVALKRWTRIMKRLYSISSRPSKKFQEVSLRFTKNWWNILLISHVNAAV